MAVKTDPVHGHSMFFLTDEKGQKYSETCWSNVRIRVTEIADGFWEWSNQCTETGSKRIGSAISFAMALNKAYSIDHSVKAKCHQPTAFNIKTPADIQRDNERAAKRRNRADLVSFIMSKSDLYNAKTLDGMSLERLVEVCEIYRN